MLKWRRIFPNMLLVGAPRPFAGKENQSESILPAPWMTCDEGSKYYQYQCLSRTMQKYPNYRGYLMFHYDVMFNYWKTIATADRDKMWLTKTGNDCGSRLWGWWDWNSPHRPATKNGYVAAYHALPPKVQKLLNDSIRPPTNRSLPFDCGFSDALYIPNRLVGKFIYYSTILYEHGVFLEIAIPSMIQWMALNRTQDNVHWQRFYPGSLYGWSDYYDLGHGIGWNDDRNVRAWDNIWANPRLTFPYAGISRVPMVLDEYVPYLPDPPPNSPPKDNSK